MNQKLSLSTGWELKQIPKSVSLDPGAIASVAADDTGWRPIAFPRQVQEALWEAGEIRDPAEYGAAAECVWVGERNWIYRTRFDCPAGRTQRLRFKGLDTLTDVYLNGVAIGHFENCFLPHEVDITGRANETGNELWLVFESPYAWMDRQTLPPHLEGVLNGKNRLLRKPHEDFNCFNGAHPHYTTIGPYDDIELHVSNAPQLDDLEVHARIDESLSHGQVDLEATLRDSHFAEGKALAVRFELCGPHGEVQATETVEARDGTAAARLRPTELALWYPRNYGAQPLYRVRASVLLGGQLADVVEKTTAFRRIQVSKTFSVSVNGLPVKLWGANLTPNEGRSKRNFPDRVRATFDLVENCNMVTLRVWGPGAPWPEQIYDEADRRGILMWGEFFHTWGPYPDTPEFHEACLHEAASYVRKVRNHPSIFMWCGGNEVYMGCNHGGRKIQVPGKALWETKYRKLVTELDPEQRHYIPNSPHDGDFPNSPLAGDSHGYTHQWFLPGEDYPTLFTENTRVSTPLLKSMRRFVPNDVFWPEGFSGMAKPLQMAKEALPQGLGSGDMAFNFGVIPPAWINLTLGPNFMVGRLGPVGDFYDTGDSPEGLIYRLGAAHGKWIRQSIERFRRGRPVHDAQGPRRVNGHYLWKLNSTWPMIFSDLIDYLLEPNIAYYAMRRALDPVLASIEVGDHLYLWAVNDSGEVVEGDYVFRVYDSKGLECAFEKIFPIRVAPGDSQLLGSVDEAGSIYRQSLAFAVIVDPQGRELTRNLAFFDIERNLGFPEATLSIRPNATQDGVIVTTDAFAHAVELAGEDDGDAFGWRFEDNFFDLMPNEAKEVKWLGNARKGTVTARSLFLAERASTQIG
ncbi:MAG: glycoside hydrolase family 2 protein [Opitutales bacterium]